MATTGAGYIERPDKQLISVHANEYINVLDKCMTAETIAIILNYTCKGNISVCKAE